MKKLIPFLSLMLFCGAFSSCDNVSEDDRFIDVEHKEAKRVVLIEEYTGQLCTNCPKGHEAIHNLLEIYPTEIVAVSIQAFGSGLDIPESNGGLAFQAENEYWKNAGSPALPSAVIDRRSGALQIDAWATTAISYLSRETPLSLEAEATLSADGNSINIDVDMSSISALNGQLQVWVTENDVVALQLDGRDYIFDYVHNHLLRAIVNGQWGENVSLQPNVSTTMSYSQTVAKDWNPENLNVVAFVYNNGGVVQAVQCEVKK